MYLEEPSAKERGVSAVYLLSGYLKPLQTNGKHDDDNLRDEENGMDLDDQPTPSGSTETEQTTGEEEIKTRTIKLVTLDQLECE